MEPKSEHLILNEVTQSYKNQYSSFSSKGKIQDKNIRWIGCILCAVYVYGSTYTFSNPGYIMFEIAEQLNVDFTKINKFFSINVYQNLVVPVFSGYFAHILGLRITVVIFSSFVLVGQVIMSIACVLGKFWMALLARFIFGLGMNAVYVLGIMMITKWFRTKELGLALSIIWVGYFTGTALDESITFILRESSKSATIMVNYATFMCLLSFIAGLIWVKIDKNHDQSGLIQQEESIDRNDANICQLFTQTRTNFGGILKFNRVTWLSLITFLLITTTYVGAYGFHSSYLYARARVLENNYLGVFNVFTLIICISLPVFGKLYDTITQSSKLIIVGALGQIFSAIWIYFLPQCSGCFIGYLPYLISGIAYSLFLAAFWPFVVRLEESKYLGLVVGLIYNASNLSQFLIELSEKMGNLFEWAGVQKIVMIYIIYGFLGVICSALTSCLQSKKKKNDDMVSN